MELIKNLPKRFLKMKKSRSVSRSDDPSFGSTTSSDSSQKQRESSGSATPTSVLPPPSQDIWGSTDFVQAFKLMDSDGDGKITTEEMQALLLRVGVGGAEPLTEQEIKLMLEEVDSDGDGCISLEEFSAIGSAFGPPSCDDELRETFRFFDADHDGRISAEELHNVFRTIVGEGRCTLEECRRMISSVAKNGDMFVCFEDFCRMMEHQLLR